MALDLGLSLTLWLLNFAFLVTDILLQSPKLRIKIVSRMQNQILDGEEYHEPFEIVPTERFATPVHVLTEDQLSISRRIQLRRKSLSLSLRQKLPARRKLHLNEH
jgi:hypothetical protein